MKLTIDDKVCLKHKLTLQETLLSLAIRSMDSISTMDTIQNLINRGVLVKDADDYKITQHWSDVIDEIICDSSNTSGRSNEQLMTLTTRIQECFPKMAQPDKYGNPTKFYFRCNKREIMLALKRFFEAFGEIIEDVTDDDIVDATQRYVASFRGNYTYMKIAKYFILKNPVKQGEDGKGYVDQTSDLMTFLENKESGEEGATNNDFTTKLI